MAGRFTIWTDFRVGKTETGKEVKMMQQSLLQLDSTASSAMSTFKGMLGAQVVGRGLSYMSMGLQEVTTQFVDFDQSVTSAAARWGDGFDRGTEGFDRLSAAARATGQATEHTSAQAGSALNYMAMAGFKAEESIGLLPDIANVATAASLDFARASDIASDALGAFGMSGGTAQQKIDGFRKIVDQATQATNTSNQTLDMWFEAIRESAPSFTAAGQEMSTLNATLGVLANSGKKGATSGYMLRNVMNRLAAPTGRAKTLLRQFNVQVADKKTGEFRNFIDILADLEKGMGKLGEVKRTAAIKEIFGERAVAGMNILLQEGSDSLRTYAAELENSQGAAQKVADKMRTSVQGRIKKIQSAATELGFKLIDAFGPRIEGYIQDISNWLDSTNNNAEPLVETITEIGGAFASVIEFVVENRDHIARLIKMWAILKGGMIIGGTITSGINAVNMGLQIMKGNAGLATVAVGKLGTSLTGMTAMIGGVTAALSAGLALGAALWDSLEANERKARQVANITTKLNQKVTPEKLQSYSDESLRHMTELQGAEVNREYSKFLGIWDPDAEEHAEARAAANDMLNKLKAEKVRRKRLQEARAQLGLEPLRFGSAASLAGNQTATPITRSETVTREEVQHTLKLEDETKKATLTPPDAGIM